MTTIAWFVRGQKHAHLVQVSMAAARAVDPTFRLIVATDEAGLDVPGAEMVRIAPGAPLYVATLEARVQVLWECREPVWFIDTDVLMLKPFPALGEAHMALTWRANVGGKLTDNESLAAMMPYNGGVIGMRPSARSIEILIWMRERLKRMAPHLQAWYGDQVALAALGGPRPVEDESLEERSIPWVIEAPGPVAMIRKLPCSTWNFTPAEADEDFTGIGALHFKGHSRKLMETVAGRLGLPWFKVEEAA